MIFENSKPKPCYTQTRIKENRPTSTHFLQWFKIGRHWYAIKNALLCVFSFSTVYSLERQKKPYANETFALLPVSNLRVSKKHAHQVGMLFDKHLVPGESAPLSI